MNVLAFTPELRARIAEMRTFAEKEENWYRPGAIAVLPGDRPEQVFEQDDYKVIFSLTVDSEDGDQLYRHMTISLRNDPPSCYPTPEIAFTLATMLGFEGGGRIQSDGPVPITKDPGRDWVFATMPHGIVVITEPCARPRSPN